MAQTYRHSALFLAALELVKLGDRNVASFNIAMACICQAKEKIVKASNEKDGLGLADQLEATAASSVGAARDADGEDMFPVRAPARK